MKLVLVVTTLAVCLAGVVAAEDCAPPRALPNPLVILVAGQSNAHFSDGVGTVYSTTGHVSINQYYLIQADFVTPTVGDPIDGSAAMVKLGDMIYSTFGVDVQIITASIGSTTSAMWAGGTTNYWIRISTNSAAFNPHMIFWIHGESDVGLSVTQATYYNNFSSMTTNFRNAGVTAPIFCAINSSGYAPGNTDSGYPAVRLAQYQAINAGIALAGPDLDVLRRTAAWVDADKVHIIGVGYTKHAEMWLRIVKNYYGYP